MPTIMMEFAPVRETGTVLDGLSKDFLDVGAKLSAIRRELPEEIQVRRGIGQSIEAVERSVHTVGADTAALAQLLLHACSQYYGTDQRIAKQI